MHFNILCKIIYAPRLGHLLLAPVHLCYKETLGEPYSRILPYQTIFMVLLKNAFNLISGFCRTGADFLGPLLAAVAEICSDFDPVSNVEPSLLKLFRNLWFYIALFGLAPPIQQNQVSTKSVSTSLDGSGSITGMALQAVSGPYMWNTQWAQAVQRIAQRTPPLVSLLFLKPDNELISRLVDKSP